MRTGFGNGIESFKKGDAKFFFSRITSQAILFLMTFRISKLRISS